MLLAVTTAATCLCWQHCVKHHRCSSQNTLSMVGIILRDVVEDTCQFQAPGYLTAPSQCNKRDSQCLILSHSEEFRRRNTQRYLDPSLVPPVRQSDATAVQCPPQSIDNILLYQQGQAFRNICQQLDFTPP